MIIVTGGAGFVGANTVHELNKLGESEILVVDNLHSSANAAHPKFLNLTGARFTDYMDKREFRAAVAQGKFAGHRIRAILHNGACSNTLEDNGEYMMDNNFTYSKELLHFATSRKIPFVYASTAAVYGLSGKFTETPENEQPLNVYGFSKLAFDNYVRARFDQFDSTVVGLRYFNVYGPYEMHKGRMASVMYHFTKQLKETGTIKMFQGSGGYSDGEQRRDFIFVRDLVNMAFFFAGLKGNDKINKGVVNAGSGAARTFNDVGKILIQNYAHGGHIEYVPFPKDLHNRYQHVTEADLTQLRRLGWTEKCSSLEEGIQQLQATLFA